MRGNQSKEYLMCNVTVCKCFELIALKIFFDTINFQVNNIFNQTLQFVLSNCDDWNVFIMGCPLHSRQCSKFLSLYLITTDIANTTPTERDSNNSINQTKKFNIKFISYV